MSKLSMAYEYLLTVEPSKDYQDYERHKKTLSEIVGNNSELWLEVIQELVERMFI